MANNLAIGLVIGAALSSGFRGTFGSAKQSIEGLGKAISTSQQHHRKLGNELSNLRQKQASLYAQMSRTGSTGRAGLVALKNEYDQISRKISQLKNKQQEYTKAIEQSVKTQKQLKNAVKFDEWNDNFRESQKNKFTSNFVKGAAITATGTSIMRTFMEQEDAATDLKIAMMKADGSFGEFDKISKIAKELGRDLPGTTKDFYRLSQALKKQGISDKILTGGALKTSAELNVLLDMDQEQGGEFLAKFMESHRLSEDELPQAADYLQRAMFAGGLSKAQMYESMKYYAPKLNSMKLTGAENTEKILAIEAMAGQQGLEGSTFGTGLNMMLSRMNKGPKMLRAATKGMKAEAQDMVKAVGVEFDFWDKKGNFKGIDAMLIEMQKFEKIREKFGDEGVGLVAEELFGIEGGRLADILAQKGTKGLEEMLAKMREQASLQERIKLKTATLSSALESLGGVWENAVGSIGAVFANDIKGLANYLQDAIEKFTPFIEQNKEWIKTIVGGIAGFIGFKLAVSGLFVLLSSFVSPFAKLYSGYRRFQALQKTFQLWRISKDFSVFGKTLGTVAKTAQRTFRFFSSGAVRSIKGIGSVFRSVGSGALRLGSALGGGLVKGITLAGKALMWLGRAMMANPIGLVIGAIALAAYLIYDNWSIIQPFFENLWSNVIQAFDNAKMWVQTKWDGVSQWFTDLWNNVPTYFSDLWTSIKTFFSDGIATLGNWISTFDPLSLFQTAFSAVLSWFGIDLPASFSGFGASIVDSLVSGIMSAWETAKNAVMGLANSVKGWFTNALDINSPSKVFTGYGENIPQGLAIGIAQRTIDAAEKSKALGKTVGNAVDASVPKSSIGNIATTISQATLGIKGTISQTKQQVSEAVKAKKEAFKSALKEQQNKKKTVGSAVKNSPTKGVGEGVKKAKAKSTGSALEKEKKSKKSVGESVKKNKEKGVGSALEKEQKAKRKKAEKQAQSEQAKRSKKGSSQPKSSALQNYQPLDREAVAGNNTNARGAITVNFSPNIHVGGECENPQNLKQQILDTLQNSLPELERLLNRVFDQRQRRAY